MCESYVGLYGSGNLNITNGGNVSNPYTYIGCINGSTGTVTVDGYGSRFINTELTVGDYGNGTLKINNGGNVTNTSSIIGREIGSTGAVMIGDTGSTWTNDQSLVVGDLGTGTINQSGGTIIGYITLGFLSTSKGTYNLQGGTLRLGGLAKGSGTAAFNFGGGTIQANANFTSSLPMNLTGIGGNATIDTPGYSITLSGILSDKGGLNKIGGGVLNLQAANTYSGTTTINSGVLALVSSGSIAASTLIDVQSGATFRVSQLTSSFNLGGTQTLKGKGTIVGAVVAAAGSRIEPGESIGTLTFNGNLTLTDGALLDYELGSITASDKISMASRTLNLNNQQFDDFTFHPLNDFGQGIYTLIDAGTITGSLGSFLTGTISGRTATLGISGNDLVLTVVPEPSVWVLLALASLGFLGFVRSRD
jgi:fibronectin-binding autotransporter adhesin